VLTATLRHKLDRAGLGAPHNAATISFDKTYRSPFLIMCLASMPSRVRSAV
jgi:hypothetical protein